MWKWLVYIDPRITGNPETIGFSHYQMQYTLRPYISYKARKLKYLGVSASADSINTRLFRVWIFCC